MSNWLQTGKRIWRVLEVAAVIHFVVAILFPWGLPAAVAVVTFIITQIGAQRSFLVSVGAAIIGGLASALSVEIVHALDTLLLGVRIQVRERVADNWALLDVRNVAWKKAAFRAEGNLIRGTDETEEPYSIRWRETDQPDMLIYGRGGHQTLNIAQASTGPLPGRQPGSGMRYTLFRFHTARIPVGGGNFSEWFDRCQNSEEGITIEVSITSDPPLGKEFRRRYLIRATAEPEWQMVQVPSGQPVTPPEPKIEFRRI